MRNGLAVVVLLLVATGAFSDTPISDPLSARGAGAQSEAVSATDGRDFLLVWTDRRGGEPAVFATRVAADGTVLDPEGIRISRSDRTGSQPAVAWMGSAYIVVWRGEEGCEFRRLARDGRFIDAGPRPILEPQANSPRVAVSDGVTLVAASRWQHGVEIAVIDSFGVARTMSRLPWNAFDLACADTGCLIVGHTSLGRIVGRRVARTGELLDATDRVLATDAMEPRVAASDSRFLVAWHDLSSWSSPSRRLWARGLDSEPFLVAQTTKGSILRATVSASGHGFLVAWTQHRERPVLRGAPRIESEPTPRIEVRAKRIGDAEDEELMIASNAVASEAPSISGNGVSHLASWIEPTANPWNGKIAAAVADRRIPVTRTATPQREPNVVACGDHLLVVWAEDLHGDDGFSILARRFQRSGAAIDATPIRIAESASVQENPVAAFDGRSYFVAWSENGRIRARGLASDGTVISEVLEFSGAARKAPAIAAMDRGFAVLHGVDDAQGRQQLVVSRVVGETVARTELGSWSGSGHAIGWNGSELVAAWTQPYAGRVLAARVSADGVLLDGEPILVGFGTESYEDVSIGCSAGECVIAWSDFLSGAKSAWLVGASSLLVGEAFHDFGEIRFAPRDRYSPVVLRSGDEFQVVARNGNGVLFARRVRSGLMSDEDAIAAPRARGERVESVAYARDGRVAVVSRPIDGPGYAGARRLFLRRLDE
jgi:hypothetical protein